MTLTHWIPASVHVQAMCLGLFAVTATTGQTPEPSNSPPGFVDVSAGVSDFHMKDRYLSPFTYGGLLFASRLTCEIPSGDAVHMITASYAIGSPTSSLQTRDVTEETGRLSYTFLARVTGWTLAGRELAASVGGGVSSFVANTDFDTHDSYGTPYHDQSWFWTHSLHPAARLEFQAWVGNSVTFDVTVPLFSLATRPGNGHWMNAENIRIGQNFLRASLHGHPVYPWESLVLFTRLSWRERVGEHFALQGSYEFTYASADVPISMRMYANTVLVGLDWVF